MVARWLSFGLLGAVVIACGGGVSLGNSGSSLGGENGDGGTNNTTKPDCSAPNACGPAPGMPGAECSDGSIGGNTGKCIEQNGACAWEIRECPEDKPACFDDKGNINPDFKKCAAPTDCVVVTYQANCCGTFAAVGVNKASQAAAQKCGDDRAATFPECGCAGMPTQADDGSQDPKGMGSNASVTCDAGVCKSSFKVETCATKVCTTTQTCCEGVPFTEPTCVEGSMCPISQAKHKKDITYLSQDDRQRLNDELMSFPLATYRYKSETDKDRPHLGFIIDDVAPTPAVLQNGERVDMYGYATMAVAALQTQAKELAELKRKVDQLERECGKSSKR